jgi:tetraacyldisaccharide 4'-kinase
MADWLQRQWAGLTFWHILLVPISWLFGFVVHLRCYLYSIGLLKSDHLDVPVIVVGNINVGGTGKTPLVIWLAAQMKQAGYTPGIISRGYGGNAGKPMQVFPDSDPFFAGDEAVLIAMRTSCPVYVSANRVDAGKSLLKAHPECNVVISDDGLQHYRLQRDVEIAVIDSAKGFGNGFLLPAGPLREPRARLKSVDAVVCNGHVVDAKVAEINPVEMRLEPAQFYNLADNHKRAAVQDFFGQKILAIAGIGNPQRFFSQLRNTGLEFESRAYVDHYAFQVQDFEHDTADVILMTEKDAVKCRAFARSNFWVLPVSAVIKDGLMPVVLNKIK